MSIESKTARKLTEESFPYPFFAAVDVEIHKSY
jgi:hypothetical protein